MIHLHDIRRQNSSEGQFILIKGDKMLRSRVNIKNGVLLLLQETECIIPSVIDIKNYHASAVQHPLFQIEGYKLIGKELIFEIYGENEEFFSKLRKYVIQQDFTERYKIIRKIRNEDDAEIWRLQNKTNQKKYVGKLFSKLNLSFTQRRAINLEISILQKINHNNLIRFIEMFEIAEKIILVFNLCDGDPLKESTLSESEIQPLMKQLLRGIVHLHENNIIHRDLKLSNIIIYCSHPIISNFSLAEFYNEQNDYLYVRCGTPGYVAPEILQRQKYDHKVDVYSIGMILYNLLKKNKDIEVSLYNLEISPLCLDFLRKVLEVNPTKRLSSNEALHHPFIQQLKLTYNQKMNYYLPLINSHSPPKQKEMKFTFKTERVITLEGEGRSRILSFEPLDSQFRQKFSKNQLKKVQNIYY